MCGRLSLNGCVARRASLLGALLVGAASTGALGQVFSSSPNLHVGAHPTTTQDTITVLGGPARVTSLRVVVRLAYGFDENLNVALVHGDTYMRLSGRAGIAGADFSPTRFSDDAAHSLFEGEAPFDGDFRPDGGAVLPDRTPSVALPDTEVDALAAFNGPGADGDWTLWINDEELSGFSGTLMYWSLEFNGAVDPQGPAGAPTLTPFAAEVDDAGDLGTTAAQVTVGSGPLSRIIGHLVAADFDPPDVDVFQIQICDPSQFSATTIGGSNFSNSLFLFDAAGRGVTSNTFTLLDPSDPDNSDVILYPTIGGTHIPGPGLYYIAISTVFPYDSNGDPLWRGFGLPLEFDRAPDGPGAANPVFGWESFGTAVTAAYHIFLTGATFAEGTSCGPACGSADFNCDGDIGTDADIESFFACLAGTCPTAPCTSTADFNADGDIGTDSDIESFFRVLAGGSC
jgi:hypothetical protein